MSCLKCMSLVPASTVYRDEHCCFPVLSNGTTERRVRHSPATGRNDQWLESSSVRSANGMRRGLFERCKAGSQTFERETKKETTSRRCWTQKIGIIHFYLKHPDISEINKVIWKHTWICHNVVLTSTLPFLSNQVVRHKSRSRLTFSDVSLATRA